MYALIHIYKFLLWKTHMFVQSLWNVNFKFSILDASFKYENTKVYTCTYVCSYLSTLFHYTTFVQLYLLIIKSHYKYIHMNLWTLLLYPTFWRKGMRYTALTSFEVVRSSLLAHGDCYKLLDFIFLVFSKYSVLFF